VGWARHVAHIWKKRSAYRVLVRKLAGKIPLGRPVSYGRMILK
jgi:hypothetical protein